MAEQFSYYEAQPEDELLLASSEQLGSLMVCQDVEPLPSLVDPDTSPKPRFTYEQVARRARITDDSRWRVLDSSLRAYEAFFGDILDEVGGRIVNLLPDNPGRPVVVVDAMATTAALHDLRSDVRVRQGSEYAGFRGFAVGLTNSRAGYGDTEDLRFIKGNVRYPRTWSRLEEEMAGAQADLIMERAVGGLSGVPQHRTFYEAAFRGLWRLLRPGGVMLLQTPDKGEMAIAGMDLPGIVPHLERQGIQAKTTRNPYMFSSALLVRKPIRPLK